METQKWHVLLPPGPGGTATLIGPLFDSEEAAWDYVARLPTEKGLRAHVLKWNRPEEDYESQDRS